MTASAEAPESKMWKCGEEYEYPVPKSEGNPWEVVLEALIKKDKVQCDAWKDEVQNLLIFAGLFSAVVTAFVIESYKSIRPDSSDLAVVLLARITMQLESGSNVTFEPPTSSLLSLPSGSPDTTRVNVFWFLSLILSLTTVLVGIVSLQWLREHQRYSDALPPKQALGIFYMRAEALEKWRVPQIFASLPLLLQAALLLFFIGIVDFLFSLSKIIAIPVGVAVALTVIFLIGTTILPTLQCFTVSLRRPMSNGPIPLPCAYKSPQSLAFRRLVTRSRRLFIFVHEFIIYTVYVVTIILPQLLNLQTSFKVSDDTWKYRLFSYRAYLFWAHEHWLEFDRTFLILRNEHFDITRKRVKDDEAPSQSFAVEPIYDSVRALAAAVKGNEHDDALTFAAYHCFQDLSQSVVDERGEFPNHHLQACYRDLVPTWNSPIANIAAIVVDPPVVLLHDIHTVLFLRLPGIFYKAINPGHILGKHMLELHTRILGHLFAAEPRRLTEGVSDGPTGFFHWYTINMASLHRYPEMQDAFYHQYFILFRSFVKTASSITTSNSIHRTFHTHSDLDDFISLAAYLTWRTVEKAIARNPDGDSSLETLSSSLEIMRKALIESAIEKRPEGSNSRDYLFCCGVLYFKRLWEERPKGSVGYPSITENALLSALCTMLDTFQQDALLAYEANMDRAQFFYMHLGLVTPGMMPKTTMGTSFARHFLWLEYGNGTTVEAGKGDFVHTNKSAYEYERIGDQLV
ncbi:hypothetical protein BDN70DRAFT_844557 [Pholiota conissans]|uniref:DUF6535 domain-containing protein n=1 Tax=Pholiota conissans TaxID=109636 RepID=A0A9P6CTS6_9AGAR|nr:hypothetical protein BDN70DRAFT_844557 [Pholiota conissans]